MNFNKAFVLGNVTRDPELRNIPSGQSVCTFGIATNRFFRNAAGERQQQVEFHNIVAWARLAEVCNQYLRKGSLVFIEGRMQTRSWQDKNSGEKRSRTEIIAETMQLGPRPQGGSAGGPPQSETAGAVKGAGDDTIPPETPPIDTVQYPGDEDEIKPEEIPF